MPDVGVLNLEIHDNSKDAGSGLNELADALERVKEKIPSGRNGIGLSKIATELKTFVENVKGTVPVFKALKGFTDGISTLSKLEKPFKIDTTGLSSFKRAVSGIKIGNVGSQMNQLRLAVSGNWGDGKNVQILSDMHDVIQRMGSGNDAQILQNVANAAKNMGDWRMNGMSGKGITKAAADATAAAMERDRIAEAMKKPRFPASENIQRFAGKRVSQVQGGEQLKMDLDALAKPAQGLGASVASQIEDINRAAEAVNKLAEALKAVKEATAGGFGKGLEQNLRGIATVVNNDISGSTIEKLRDFADAMSGLKGLGDIHINLKGADKIARTVKESVGTNKDIISVPIIDPVIENIGSTVETGMVPVREAYKELLDFAQFDVSSLPFSAIGDKLEESARQWRAFGDAVRDTFEMLRNLFGGAWLNQAFGAANDARMARALPGGTQGYLNGMRTGLPDGYIIGEGTVSGDEPERIGESVGYLTEAGSRTMELRDCLADTFDYAKYFANELHEAATQCTALSTEVKGIKETTYGWGQGSIKGILWGDNKLGEDLRGWHGSEAFEEAVRKVSEGTGLAVDEIKRQVEELMSAVRVPFKVPLQEATQDIEPVAAKIREIGTEATGSESKLELLRKKLEILQWMARTGFNLKGNMLDPKQMVELKLQIQSIIDQIDRLQQKEDQAMYSGGNLGDINSRFGYGLNDQTVESVSPTFDSLRNSMREAGVTAKTFTNELTGVDNELKQKKKDASDAASGFDTLKNALHNVAKAAKNTGIYKLFEQFKRIATRMFLRGIIKQITGGFKEGIENLYHYSQGAGTSFAKDMDSAASSLLLMKNSIGAAVAPLIQSLIPYLQQAVNWFIELVNWANQFFALLRGQQTWTKAVPYTAKAFDDVKKSASGASNAMKELLADWDELNIIQSENSGGGSGSGAYSMSDYMKMFEEQTVFESKIKNIVEWVKDHFDLIKDAAIAIGAAILTWKVSNAFGDTLTSMQKLELTAGITLAVIGIKLALGAGYEMGKNGITGANIAEGVVGVLATAAGGALIGFAVGGPAGALIGASLGTGISLTILGMEYEEGTKDALYGDVSKSTEEIQTEINKLFKFDVDAMLNNATVNRESITNAKTAVETALYALNAKYINFKANITTETAKELAESVGETVNAANKLLESYSTVISVGFGYKSVYGDAAEEIQKKELMDLAGLESYITDLGKRIGTLLEGGIVDGTSGLLEDLMTELTAVTEAIERGKASASFQLGVENIFGGAGLENADRQTVIEYAKQYKQQLEKARESAMINVENTAAAKLGRYNVMVERNNFHPGTYSPEELEDAWNKYQAYIDPENIKKVIEDEVNKVTEGGYGVFVANIVKALSGAIGNINEENLSGLIRMHANNDISGYEDLGEWLGNDTNLQDWITKSLGVQLGWGKFIGDEGTQLFADTLAEMGMTGWDMLTDNMKKAYVQSILDVLGNSADTYKKLKDELGISVEDFLPGKDEWDKSSVEFQQSYIQMLKEAYGEDAVAKAMESAFGAEETKNVIEKWERQVKEQAEESVNNAVEEAAGGQQPVEPYVAPVEIIPEETGYELETEYDTPDMTGITTGLEGISGFQVDPPDFSKWKETFDTVKQEIADFADGLWKKLTFQEEEMPDTSGYRNRLRNAPKLASAGYGMPLTMMTTGGTTASTTDKMESEMTNVDRNTAETNALLRTAGELLRQIAGKNWTVNVTPSSRMGAVNRASNSMYERVTGEFYTLD